MIETENPRTIWPEFDNMAGKPDLSGVPCVNGNPHLWETDWLCRIAQSGRTENAFEFGTFNGATALYLAHVVTGTVWTLDLPEGAQPKLPPGEDDRRWLGAAKVAWPGNVEQLWGDSADFDFGEYRGRCGLVFVMGASSYEYMHNDVSRALELASEGGVVILHIHQDDNPHISRLAEDFSLMLLGGSRLAVVRRNASREGGTPGVKAEGRFVKRKAESRELLRKTESDDAYSQD